MPLDPPDAAPAALAQALAARYGADEAPERLLGGEVIGKLLAHRSVRAYRPDPLPEGLVETLVAAAQSAASSSNLQLWSVVAVRDAERRARLAEFAGGQKHMVQAPLILVWIADLARGHDIAAQAGQPVEGFEFLESFTVAAVDAALAAQNAVVAAESLGLGTVYIGGLRNRPLDVAALLELPAHAAAVFGLVVGWPDPTLATAVKPRLPQAAVLHHERYALAPPAGRRPQLRRDLPRVPAKPGPGTDRLGRPDPRPQPQRRFAQWARAPARGAQRAGLQTALSARGAAAAQLGAVRPAARLAWSFCTRPLTFIETWRRSG